MSRSSGVADHPEAYLAEDRRRAVLTGEDVDGRRRGSALFADISGYTTLTEALVVEHGARRGAEELTAVLDRVLGAVVDVLHRWGGSVLSFSGDAVTCWLDGDDGLAATACALGMQAALDDVGTVRTPSGRTVVLGMKVAVATGPARRFVVGDPSVQLLDVLAGSLVDDLAATERQARVGEVLVHDGVLDAHRPRLRLGEHRAGCAVVVALARPLPEPDPLPQATGLPDAAVRPWLLPAVHERLTGGHGEFLAELRPAVPLFVRFGGLDFDGDEDAPHALDAFVRRAQAVVAVNGGSVLQLTVGDKGAYLYAVLGSPTAHEDDAARACGAALDLLALDPPGAARPGAVRDLQVGVALGRVRSGTTGHPARRTFCCLGDCVNLAARLMSAAEPGQALVSAAVASGAAAGYTFDAPLSLRLKGIAEPVAAHRLAGRARRMSHGAGPAAHEPAFVGREEEARALRDLLVPVLSGAGRVVGVSGAPGTGKARLVREVLAERPAGARVAAGAAVAYGSAAAWSAWHGVFGALLDVPDDVDAGALAERLEHVLPEQLRPRLPLVGNLLGIPLPDNDLTAALDAKLRKASLEDLAVRLVEHLATAPVALVVEDAEGMDGPSRDLLAALAPAIRQLPVAVVLVYRPTAAPALGLPDDGVDVEEVVLGPLGPDATRRLVADELAALLGGAPGAPEVGDDVVREIAARCEGNPLHVRELCRYVVARGADLADPAGLAELDLPDSLHRLVLSRIDLLPEQPRRTVKVAAVVGRSFDERVVGAAYPELGTPEDLAAACTELGRAGLVEPAGEPGERTWRFASAVACDVAYDSIPFALRSVLHTRVGLSLEDGADGDPGRRVAELAHHFWRGDDPVRRGEYALRAGVAAQAAYANATARQWFERVVPLLDPQRRPPVLVRLGKVLELIGEWEAARSAYARSRDDAEAVRDDAAAAWATTWRADVARKQGRYDEAASGLADAAARFAALGDDAGRGQVLHLTGTLHAQRGDLDAAEDAYRTSLVLRERLGDDAGRAGLLSNLAVVAEYRGDYGRARRLGEQALALRERAGDLWGIGVSHNNLGMIALLQDDPAEAVRRFGEAMRLHAEVGDAWMVAIGHDNLGNTHRELGDLPAAGREYAAALAGYLRHADGWALAALYEDVALAAARAGEAALAFELAGAADGVRARLGAPRPPDQAARLDEVLAGTAGGADAAARRAAGAGLDDDGAAELVRRACDRLVGTGPVSAR